MLKQLKTTAKQIRFVFKNMFEQFRAPLLYFELTPILYSKCLAKYFGCDLRKYMFSKAKYFRYVSAFRTF